MLTENKRCVLRQPFALEAKNEKLDGEWVECARFFNPDAAVASRNFYQDHICGAAGWRYRVVKDGPSTITPAIPGAIVDLT